jgi:hypothetical protein
MEHIRGNMDRSNTNTILLQNLKGRKYSRMLKRHVGCEMNSSGSGHRQVAGLCKHDPVSIAMRQRLDSSPVEVEHVLHTHDQTRRLNIYEPADVGDNNTFKYSSILYRVSRNPQ